MLFPSKLEASTMPKFQRTKLHGAALLIALASTAACAQPAGQSGATTPRTAAGGITLQQFTSRHEEKMLAADTDGDGRVSRAEFIAAATAGTGDPASRFAKLDTNGDGMLDKAEIDAMLARRFKKLDADKNGVASAEERAAAHAGKGKAKRKGADT